jgi:hypothetical protein
MKYLLSTLTYETVLTLVVFSMTSGLIGYRRYAICSSVPLLHTVVLGDSVTSTQSCYTALLCRDVTGSSVMLI